MTEEVKITTGTPRFAVLALLKERTCSQYDLQQELRQRGISPDATRWNLRFLMDCGIVRLHSKRLKNGRNLTNYYCLSEDIFCFMGSLLVTNPLCMFPCPHFVGCTVDEPCQFIHHVSILLGMPAKDVKRITHGVEK